MIMIFFRDEGFYPLDLEIPKGMRPYDVASAHAQTNPGTRRIENAEGEVIWPCKRPEEATATAISIL